MADDTSATPEQVRAAIEGLKAALDAHLAAVESRAGENDPRVQAAYDLLASAGEVYDDMLFAAYEEVTPFGPVDTADEDEDDADEDDADEDDADEDEEDEDEDDDADEDEEEEDDDLVWEPEGE